LKKGNPPSCFAEGGYPKNGEAPKNGPKRPEERRGGEEKKHSTTFRLLHFAMLRFLALRFAPFIEKNAEVALQGKKKSTSLTLRFQKGTCPKGQVPKRVSALPPKGG